jgi:hypothetical protein
MPTNPSFPPPTRTFLAAAAVFVAPATSFITSTNMSTRKRTTAQSPRGQPLSSEAADTENLPPTRPKKRISKSVQPPLANMSLTTFIYSLVGLATLYLAIQSYSIFAWSLPGFLGGKSPASPSTTNVAKEKVLNFATKKSGAVPTGVKTASAEGGSLTVEDRINDLAAALGMPSGDLASAIAVAVREYVPPASLSSISAAAKETGSSGVVDELLGEEAGSKAEETESGGGVSGILGKVVGMDEPPSEGV